MHKFINHEIHGIHEKTKNEMTLSGKIQDHEWTTNVGFKPQNTRNNQDNLNH